jgi:SAM-dependent methyltransferase
VNFAEFTGDVRGFPNTKPYRCLLEEVGLQPKLDLFRYAVKVGPDARDRAKRYVEGITGAEANERGKFPFVVMHYQGISSRMHKDLPEPTVRDVAAAVKMRGRTLAILDIERYSTIVDQATVFSPLNGNPVWLRPGMADPETMAGIMELAELFIGIDSGPLHMAGGLDVQAVGIWTHHHPIRFFDIADNVVHLVPTGHRRLAGGHLAADTFHELYRHEVYGCLKGALIDEVHKALVGDREQTKPRSDALPGLTATSYNQLYYTQHVNAGLDYLGHGEWQREYASWLADVFGWRGTRVLDVGCACGSIMRGLGHVGVIVEGVDVSEYMVDRGRRKWPDQAKLMHVADAVNLHLFEPGSWAGIHCAQVAEHWKPELVPFILAELARICTPGSIMFLCLDTTELFERNKRNMDDEDKTHVCVRPRAFWSAAIVDTTWADVTDEFRPQLENHAASFLRRYDWEFFVFRHTGGSGEGR